MSVVRWRLSSTRRRSTVVRNAPAGPPVRPGPPVRHCPAGATNAQPRLPALPAAFPAGGTRLAGPPNGEPPTGRRGGRIADYLRCGSSRFAVLYFLPYFAAMSGSGRVSWGWVALGAGYWFLHSMGTELLNRCSDRTEDAINRPERTALCERIGFGRLREVAIVSWIAVVMLDIVFVVLRPSILLAILLLLAGLSAVGYSYGPRLARNRYVAPIVLTFHFGGTFMIGWVLGHPALDESAWRDFGTHALPFFVVSCATLLALGGAKDLTDMVGDQVVGYRSAWLALVRKHESWLTLTLVSSTFVMTSIFVVIGSYPRRFLVLFALAPLALALYRCLRFATSSAERHVTREFFYHYWMAYLVVAVPSYAPDTETFIVVAGSLAYWILTTQFLHWSPGVRLAEVRTAGFLITKKRRRLIGETFS